MHLSFSDGVAAIGLPWFGEREIAQNVYWPKTSTTPLSTNAKI